MLVVTRASEIA